MKHKKSNIWWGPPKQFSTEFEERKISWLELFYDLVYVIAISKITLNLSHNLTLSGFLDYTYAFMLIFWSWLNGSLHHDAHGSGGIRTHLMTLWQIIIVAALVVTQNSPPETIVFNGTIAIMVMQAFITYLWWSVGIYDKTNRKFNKYYTIFFLISFALMFSTLYLKQPYVRILFYVTLVLNYLPPFIITRKLHESGIKISLPPSMSERLGLFTIIIFGEVILGVVNGVSGFKELSFQVWLNFGLGVLIVFALWWIFFSVVADRPCKTGFLNSNLVTLFYIPMLMALGVIGVAFSGLFQNFEVAGGNIKLAFGISLSTFLMGIVIISQRLEYPTAYVLYNNRLHKMLSIVSIVFLLLSLINLHLTLFTYLLIVLLVLISIAFTIFKNNLISSLKHE